MPAVDVQIVNPDGQRVTLPGAFAYGAPPTGVHAYFDALRSRPEHWASCTFRDPAQLLQLRVSQNTGQWVFFDPAMDAAKVVVPEFNTNVVDTVSTAVGAADAAIQLTKADGAVMQARRSLKIDNEILIIQRNSGEPITNRMVRVLRGQGGTTPSAHAVGATVLLGTNSLINNLHFPFPSTTDGHTWFFTWDERYSDSFLPARTGLTNYKTYQLAAKYTNGQVAQWVEPETAFSGATNPSTDIGKATVRTVSLNPPLNTYPALLTAFVIKPNVWTRRFVLVEQRANDTELVTYWVADETRSAVKLLDRYAMGLSGAGGIEQFWLEFNTSQDTIKHGRGDMLCYVRNFISLKDVADPTTLLVKPS